MGLGTLNRLTARQLAGATSSIGDGGGLYFNPTAPGAGNWTFKFTSPLTAKRREMGFGTYPAVSLADARRKAAEARLAVQGGIDPLEANGLPARSGVTPSFITLAEKMIETRKSGWRNAKHAEQWRSTINTYARPLHHMPVDKIKPADVHAVLAPIWLTKPETARRLRGRIEAVFHYAEALGLEVNNPAAITRMRLLLPKQKAVVVHHEAVPLADAPAAFARILEAARRDPWSGAAALALTILTAARSGEIRHLEVGDINLSEKLITIPGERMKGGKPHRKPLPPIAAQLLRDNLAHPRRSVMAFPSRKWGPLSDMTLAATLKRLKIPGTVHGWRSVFRTWSREIARADRDAAEQMLAHQIYSDTEAAYLRSDFLDERRKIAAAWADWLTPAGL